MTKQEWSMSVLAVCVCGIAGAVTALVVVRACGASGLTVAQGVGVLLMVLAFGLLAGCLNLARWAASKLAVRRMWRGRQNKKNPPIGYTAEEVAMREQVRRLHEAKVRDFNAAVEEIDRELNRRTLRGKQK
jgi:hypothetical protein